MRQLYAKRLTRTKAEPGGEFDSLSQKRHTFYVFSPESWADGLISDEVQPRIRGIPYFRNLPEFSDGQHENTEPRKDQVACTIHGIFALSK